MRYLLSIITVFLLTVSAAGAETVTGIDIVSNRWQTKVVITRMSAADTPKVFQLNGESPRVVIDWNDAQWSVTSTEVNQSGKGLIKHVRYAKHGEQGLRVVLDLAPNAKLSSQEIGTDHISLLIGSTEKAVAPKMAASASITSSVEPETRDVPFPRVRPAKNRPVRMVASGKPVIVIDPGHGGRDPGAIGHRGTHEKKITMKAALELKTQLMATGRYTVILTRSSDKYIAHEERLRIARAGGADLFISIHADSTKSKSARGASVYTLADRAKKRSKGIVNNQNWILDVDLTTQSDPVGDILVDLAQRKTTTQSAMFANLLVKNLSQSTKLVGNSHRRAGYFVLLAPDVPAVLLELGFISNSQDEKLLKSAAHRRKILRSVVTAINTYFATQKS